MKKEKQKKSLKSRLLKLAVTLTVIATVIGGTILFNPFDIVGKIKTGTQKAQDFTAGVAYINDNKEVVIGLYNDYKNGTLTKEELIQKVTTELDVEYIYNFIDEFGTEEIKAQVNDYLKQLEESGVDIEAYLPDDAKDVYEDYKNGGLTK